MERAITASEANQHFSELLRHVADGQSFTVTSRGRPIARVLPVDREVSPVLRGTVFEPQLFRVTPAVEDRFGFAEMTVVSMADLYGGKMQPRSTASIRAIYSTSISCLENEGIDENLFRAFSSIW